MERGVSGVAEMKLLYILYSLLSGALFSVFIAGREKFKARFSAVMHSLGTPVRLLKRFAVTSAASLRKSTEHIKTAAKNAVRIKLKKFRVAAGGISVKTVQKLWQRVKLHPLQAKRHIPKKLKLLFHLVSAMLPGSGIVLTPEKLRINVSVNSPIRVGRLKQVGTEAFGRFVAAIWVTIKNMRRCISYPKTWWKAITTIRDEPRRNSTKVRIFTETRPAMRGSVGFARRISLFVREHFGVKMWTGRASKIHPEPVRVRPLLDAKKLRLGHSTRVFPNMPKILIAMFSNFGKGRTLQLDSPKKLSLRQFFSTLEMAGTTAKIRQLVVHILLYSRLRTHGFSIALHARMAADRLRLWLRSAGQKIRVAGQIISRLSLFPICVVEGAGSVTKAKQASYGARTTLSSWIFPRPDGNDLYITQAYAVTETAENIMII